MTTKSTSKQNLRFGRSIEKLDHLMNKQWERLVQIQEIQLEQLAELKAYPRNHASKK